MEISAHTFTVMTSKFFGINSGIGYKLVLKSNASLHSRCYTCQEYFIFSVIQKIIDAKLVKALKMQSCERPQTKNEEKQCEIG